MEQEPYRLAAVSESQGDEGQGEGRSGRQDRDGAGRHENGGTAVLAGGHARHAHEDGQTGGDDHHQQENDERLLHDEPKGNGCGSDVTNVLAFSYPPGVYSDRFQSTNDGAPRNQRATIRRLLRIQEEPWLRSTQT